MATARIRKYKNKDEMERALDEFITLGYDVKERGEETILVKKHDNGSLCASVVISRFFATFLFFFALFAANAFDSFLNPRDAPTHG